MLAVTLLGELTFGIPPPLLIPVDLLDVFEQKGLSVVSLHQALQILLVDFDILHLLNLSVRKRKDFTKVDARGLLYCSLHLEEFLELVVAFVVEHALSPRIYRELPRELGNYPRIKFHLLLCGVLRP